MSDITTQLHARRAIEDRAAKLGAKRRDAEARMTRNTHRIIDLLRDARDSGVPLEHLAALLGVSRPTLYKWREIGVQIPNGMSAAEWASQRTPEGHARPES